MSSLLCFSETMWGKLPVIYPFLSLNTYVSGFLCYFGTILPFCKGFVFISGDEQYLDSVWVVKYGENN